MNEDDKFKLYFQELKDIYEGYIKFVITMSIAIVGAIGWFMTSTSARDFVHAKSVRDAFILAIILTILTELFVTLGVKRLSVKIAKIVKEVANKLSIPVDYYEYRILKPLMLIVLYVFHLILLVLLIVLIFKS